jgi:hypothetical protein
VFDGEAVMAAYKSTTDTNTPRFNRRSVSFAKKPSTAFSHEQDAGVKWKVKRSCRLSQAHPGMLVRSVIVEGRMDGFGGRSRRLDGVEEAHELLMPMARHVAADHRAVENVERGEQRRRPVPFVVTVHRTGASLLQRPGGVRSSA